MGEVHGGKFGKKHVTKCGEYKGKLPKDDRVVSYVQGIEKVTCPKCKAKHVPGKC